ncbi:hypothetical protein [Gracilimonas sediminicola]|uniref:hypothetical protein n=1 Tax=Gracilimonas sediminicola TaxID=2952158 RepID=UPI0038D38C8F
MLDPEQIKDENSITGKQVLFYVSMVVVTNVAIFCIAEYSLSYDVVDSTAEIIKKEISAPANLGDDPFLLIIKREGQIYHVRVPVEYYRELKPGTMVLLVDTRSGVLDRNLKTRLFDYPVYLKQSDSTPNTPNNKANKDKVWSWNNAPRLLFPGGQA